MLNSALYLTAVFLAGRSFDSGIAWVGAIAGFALTICATSRLSHVNGELAIIITGIVYSVSGRSGERGGGKARAMSRSRRISSGL
jgi:hypothetical protein